MLVKNKQHLVPGRFISMIESGTNQTECRRCGTCCRKGGPGLHLEDQHLVDSGKISLNRLLTIRQGEPAFDNVTGTTAPAVTDIIKIKGIDDNASDCAFYDPKKKGCRIYEQRPVECAALQCWDTREIEKIYCCRRLTRRHLLAKVEGLWDLVEDHQQRCDYAYIHELATKIRNNHQGEEAQKELIELIRYDQQLRQVTLERSKFDSEMLDFLFGRPLSTTISMFQLKVTRTDQKMIIKPTGAANSQVCYRRNGF